MLVCGTVAGRFLACALQRSYEASFKFSLCTHRVLPCTYFSFFYFFYFPENDQSPTFPFVEQIWSGNSCRPKYIVTIIRLVFRHYAIYGRLSLLLPAMANC